MTLEEDEVITKPKKSKLRVMLLTISLALLVLIGAGIGTALYAANALQPVPASDQEVRINVPPGTGSVQIANLLKEQGLIKSPFIFTAYLKWKNQGSHFQAGEYAMKPGMTLDQMIEQLNNGQTVKKDVFRVTIPEGFTVRQIAEKLSAETPLKADVFLQNIEKPEQFQAAALEGLPNDKAIKYRLEGYLFPETYEFKKGSNEQDFVLRSLQELDKKMATLPSDWKVKLQEKNLTLHQILTIASLIEREVVVEEERPLVASVIYNRLNQKMPLQIDATIQYLLDKPKERLFEKDLQVDSPYNTYKNPGLPPGPIASPSLASIKAALYPAETKFMFYVTKKDGSQGHFFAETFEEHKKNIEASKKGTS
jgi:UPF0755 protein